jgi:glycosyltransferase involved in cell wall biosynthesis
MYPSRFDNYGIFAQRTFKILEQSDYIKVTLKELIKRKLYNKYINILRYIKLIIMTYIKSLILPYKYDAIYIQYIWLHVFFIYYLFPFYKINKKEIIINFHGEDLMGYKNLNSCSKNIFQKICDKSNLIIVPSEYFKKELELINSGYRSKIFIFPSGGIDTSIFDKNVNSFPRNKVPRIIYCSRFDKNKGWDNFIEAVNILLNEWNIDCQAVMIGFGYESNDVRQLINKRKLKKKFSICENISQVSIQAIYSSSDVFVFPTRLPESLGLVALEAMSCGLPVIGSKIGALSEYIIDGYSGYLFEDGNIYSLAQKLKNYLCLCDEEKQVLSDNAYNISKKYFDYNVSKKLICRLAGIR